MKRMMNFQKCSLWTWWLICGWVISPVLLADLRAETVGPYSDTARWRTSEALAYEELQVEWAAAAMYTGDTLPYGTTINDLDAMLLPTGTVIGVHLEVPDSESHHQISSAYYLDCADYYYSYEDITLAVELRKGVQPEAEEAVIATRKWFYRKTSNAPWIAILPDHPYGVDADEELGCVLDMMMGRRELRLFVSHEMNGWQFMSVVLADYVDELGDYRYKDTTPVLTLVVSEPLPDDFEFLPFEDEGSCDPYNYTFALNETDDSYHYDSYHYDWEIKRPGADDYEPIDTLKDKDVFYYGMATPEDDGTMIRAIVRNYCGADSVEAELKVMTVEITSESDNLCAYGDLELTAEVTNGGANPTFAWFINGVEIPGATGQTFTWPSELPEGVTPDGNGEYGVVVQVQASPELPFVNPVACAEKVVTVHPLPSGEPVEVCDTVFMTWTAGSGEEKPLWVGVQAPESWVDGHETFRVDWGDGTYLSSSSFMRDTSFTKTYVESGSYQVMVYTTASNVRIEMFACSGTGIWGKDNGVTSLNVSRNPALRQLSCLYNQLTSLDVSQNQALEDLFCSYNQLSSLDVSQNVALESLECSYNQLSLLDVSRNVALKDLRCDNNQLTLLDVSRNVALTDLRCDYNQLLSLDVSRNVALESLECSYNQLSLLDVSRNVALKDLRCDNNQLSLLDVSRNVALKDLRCDNNQLTLLDVSQNATLEALYCENNQLSLLNMGQNQVLWRLYCTNNQLSLLDVSQNQALEDLSCSNNQLLSLDVSQNPALRHLWCYNNQLSLLDVSQNVALEVLYCNNNQLSSLDVSRNPALEYFECYGNRLIVALDTDNGLDLDTLPGMDVSRIGSVRGGRIEGTRLFFDTQEIAYRYATHFPGYHSWFDTMEITLIASEPLAPVDPDIPDDPGTPSDPGNPGGPGEVPTDPTANETSLAAAPFAYVQGRTVYLSDNLGEVEAFTATGQRVYRGFDRTIALPNPGMYILRVVADGRRSKVIVK